MSYLAGTLDINNLPDIEEHGYEVVTNDEGTLWHYGFFTDEARAQEAVDEHADRFMVEVD